MGLWVLTVLLLATGCRTARVMASSEARASDSVVIRETIRDTTVIIRADNSLLRALLECDSLGRVRMKELLEYRAGDRLKPPNVDITDNVLTAKAEIDSMAIYLQLRDRYEKHTTARMQTDKEIVTVEVNRLTWWQGLWVKLGKGLFGALAAGLIVKLFKNKLLTIWKKITKT